MFLYLCVFVLNHWLVRILVLMYFLFFFPSLNIAV